MVREKKPRNRQLATKYYTTWTPLKSETTCITDGNGPSRNCCELTIPNYRLIIKNCCNCYFWCNECVIFYTGETYFHVHMMSANSLFMKTLRVERIIMLMHNLTVITSNYVTQTETFIYEVDMFIYRFNIYTS
jgi:hypothetical protein